MINPNQNNKSTALFCGGLTFSWLIVWASFTAAPLAGRPFPLPAAFLTFAVAAAVFGWAANRRWRNYHFLFLHLVGLIAFVSYTLHVSVTPAADFFSAAWFSEIDGLLHHGHGFMTVFLVVGWTIVFWFSGTQLGRRPQSYLLICNRFDAGLSGLFALLLVQLVLQVRGGLSIAAPPDAFYMYSFFLCGLLAIGLVRHGSMAEKQFLPGIRGIAVLVLFAVVILTATGLMAALAPPLLVPIAEDGYVVLKTVARPLGDMLTRILIFVLKRDYDQPVSQGGITGSPGEMFPEGTNHGGGWLARLLAEGLIGLLFIGLLIAVGYLVWFVMRWLLRRDSGPQEISPGWNRIADFLGRLWAWLQYGYRAIRMHFGGPRNIGRLFDALQTWGRLGGVSRRSWETPQEYAGRLSLRFPQTAGDINTIVGAFQRQVYGETPLDSSAIKTAYSAWRRLSNPLRWPSRLRSLFDFR